MKIDVQSPTSVRNILGVAHRPSNGALSNTERQASLYRALHELAVSVAGMTDVSTLARTIVEHASSLTGADTGALYLLNAERDSLVSVVVLDHPGTLPPSLVGVLAQTVQPGSGVTGGAFERIRSISRGNGPGWFGAGERGRRPGSKLVEPRRLTG